jgi:hypothetical protein
MNMDIIALWEDFNSDNTPPEGTDILAYLQNEYKFDEQEVMDLMMVSNVAIAEFFDLKQFEKKKNRESFHSMVGLFMMAFFFGMYLEQNEHWNWPNKK